MYFQNIKDSKTVENVAINTIVNASNEIIDITGYKYDSSNVEVITIGTGENVINLY